MLQRLTQLQQLLKRTASGAWIPEIDGLRFVAILPVILQHLLERFYRNTPALKPEVLTDDPTAFFISRGTVGVFLFFAVSGFVLALPFARHYLQAGPRVPLKQYFLRRLTRIEPPYLIWMTLFAAVLWLKGAFPLPELFRHWLASISYTHNLIFNDYTRINPVAWSLEVEIQFYLLAPVLTAAYFSIRKTWIRRSSLATIVLITILLQTSFGPLPFVLKASLVGQIQHFLIGFLMADFYLNSWKDKPHRSFWWDLAAAPAFIVMCYSWTSNPALSIVFALALGVLFTAGFNGVFFRKALSNTWVAVTGGMCYTIYLTHLPLLQALTPITGAWAVGRNFWLNFALQLALLLPLIWFSSALFFILLEKPFMQHKIKLPSFSLNIKRLALPFVLLFGMSQTGTTQTSLKDPVGDVFSIPASPKLKPVADLCAVALQNAPELKAKQIDLEKQALAVSIQRRSWADLLALSLGGIYGNGSALDANSDAFGTRYLLTDRRTAGLNVSVSVKITGGDLLTRGQKTQIQRLQVDRLLQEKEMLQQQIRSALIAVYFQTEQALKILQYKAESVENMRLALEIAEKYFREGNYKADEYSTLLEKSNSAKELYVQAQTEAQKQVLLLREFVGDEIFMR